MDESMPLLQISVTPAQAGFIQADDRQEIRVPLVVLLIPAFAGAGRLWVCHSLLIPGTKSANSQFTA